ncbi:MAG: sulfatase-like hydrolase/transferase [Acidobacteria bacterium]|nr:sulfatase-like hydrolase/transferase [Acidobacteriota bacterium]
MRRWRMLLVTGLSVAAVAAVFVGAPQLRSLLRARVLHQLRGANLLLVTLDTTRADRLGCYGHAGAETPVLDGLARDGVLFERCITPTAFTLPSHASIMTGLQPMFHGVRLNGGVALSDAHPTLAKQLRENGYRCGGFVGAFVLDSRWGLNQGFEAYDDEFALKPGEMLDLARVQRPGNTVVDAALQWLQAADERPFFAWVHLYDPHTPYEPPDPYRTRFAGGPSRRYDGEIAFADSQVGRLLDWLRSSGKDERTIVIVIGDHGEGLGSHREEEHGFFIYDYAVRVPLIVRLPGGRQQGTRVGAQTRTIDVVPTVLELLGVAPPARLDGESLVPLLADPRRQGAAYAYSESVSLSMQYGWSALYSLRTPEYTYIDAPRPELYAPLHDPGEEDNLVGRLPGVAEELRATLAQLREAGARGAPDPQEANLDEETMRALASLGYVGGTTRTDDGAVRADPKDMLEVYDAIGVAAGTLSQGDHAGAVSRLEAVLKQDPGNPQARFLLAAGYEKLGRVGDARVVLDGVLQEDPENLRALIAMAGILAAEGEGELTVAICKRALAKDTRNTQAMALIADAYMDRNDNLGALPYLQEAVAIQPKLTRNRNNLAACLIGLRRFDEAEAELNGILSTHPKFPLAHFNLGLLYEESGRLGDARTAYAKELELQPDSVVARFNLANLFLRSGDTPAAEDQLRQLLKANPDEPRAYLFLARALLARAADPAEVLPLVREGLDRSQSPDLKALGYFLLADVYSRQGRRVEVEGALRSAQYYKAQTAPVQVPPHGR